MSDQRYAEGQREASECRHCGGPVWIVYHGENANHTVEPRDLPPEWQRVDAIAVHDRCLAERDQLRADLAQAYTRAEVAEAERNMARAERDQLREAERNSLRLIRALEGECDQLRDDLEKLRSEERTIRKVEAERDQLREELDRLLRVFAECADAMADAAERAALSPSEDSTP